MQVYTSYSWKRKNYAKTGTPVTMCLRNLQSTIESWKTNALCNHHWKASRCEIRKAYIKVNAIE